MREEMYDNPFFDDFNENWDSENHDWNEMSCEQDDIENDSLDNLPDWIDDVEDPDHMDDFNFGDDFEDDMKWD